ncbi:MAG: hypothetical protein ACRBFS_21920 [Aureispira sp.]
MRYLTLFLALSFLFSCATSTPTSTTTTATTSVEKNVFEDAYYQDLQKNIVRLHHLLQGTFTAHEGNETKEITSWTVSEGDSVVLYSVPLGDVHKDGYWVYSYEFMTSLPGSPIYTSIKRLEQVNRDTVDVFYYKTKEAVDIHLMDLLELSRLNEKINLEDLILRKKRVRYARQTSSHFIGESLVYQDPDRDYLRQNVYDVSPNFYQVNATFYDKENQQTLDIKKRPNLLVRRSMDYKLLRQLAKQG